MRTVLPILLVFALAAPAPAAIYRCRDKKGVLILTDDPVNFPKGCKPEGNQGETTVPSAAGDNRRPSSTSPPPAGGARSAPERTAPSETREPPPAGSSGVPPGLNRPDRFGTPPATRGESGPEQAPTRPGAAIPPQNEIVLSAGPEMERWLEEARSLNREYLEAQTGPPPPAGTPDRLHDIRKRIDAFTARLDSSPLPSQDRAAVEKELPPQRP